MKVLFVDSVHPILEDRLLNMGFKCEHDYTSDRKTILNKLPNYEGLVIRSRTTVDKELLGAANKLKFIARSGAGVENIDCKEAKKRGIHLISAPEGNRQAVGEHTVGMILSLFNKIALSDKEIRFGKWDREANRGIELSGKTIGIIGYGNNGSAFAEVLKGFDVTILAYDKYLTKYPYQSTMESIYKQADIVSLHVPLTAETTYLVNNDFIHKFEKDFYLINTARGKCVNTKDLVSALEKGKIKYENERWWW